MAAFKCSLPCSNASMHYLLVIRCTCVAVLTLVFLHSYSSDTVLTNGSLRRSSNSDAGNERKLQGFNDMFSNALLNGLPSTSTTSAKTPDTLALILSSSNNTNATVTGGGNNSSNAKYLDNLNKTATSTYGNSDAINGVAAQALSGVTNVDSYSDVAKSQSNEKSVDNEGQSKLLTTLGLLPSTTSGSIASSASTQSEGATDVVSPVIGDGNFDSNSNSGSNNIGVGSNTNFLSSGTVNELDPDLITGLVTETGSLLSQVSQTTTSQVAAADTEEDDEAAQQASIDATLQGVGGLLDLVSQFTEKASNTAGTVVP